ncbi:hypothetical protein SCLCIDRAFT_934945 [Scleroderma citrinum Foug A]|uniref:Uncharacterized protein n=1 Tax=Scleroderma citrinum Foug A TaxID=1036808 RepID=A0A0C3DJ53_9AGAM|nr:hypothetical protein SCLCIDRAFT_934945 [Scleroderma citrinum Foug A]
MGTSTLVYQRCYGPAFICDVYLDCVPDIFQLNVTLNRSVVSALILTALVSCYEALHYLVKIYRGVLIRLSRNLAVQRDCPDILNS